MKHQSSFTDIEFGNRKRKTRRDEFLEVMEHIIPWEEWVKLVEPHYPKGKRGRPPREIETMLRMLLLQQWFNLSDEGVEDAIYVRQLCNGTVHRDRLCHRRPGAGCDDAVQFSQATA